MSNDPKALEESAKTLRNGLAVTDKMSVSIASPIGGPTGAGDGPMGRQSRF